MHVFTVSVPHWMAKGWTWLLNAGKFFKSLEHIEPGKLHALCAKNKLACQRPLRAYVLCVLMYQCVLGAYVLTCLMCLHAHVPTCFAYLGVLCAYMPTCLICLTCSHANVSCMLTFSHANIPCKLMCEHAILNNVNSYIIQIFKLYLGLMRGNIDVH